MAQISELEYNRKLGNNYTIYELCILKLSTAGIIFQPNDNSYAMRLNRPDQNALNKLQELVDNILDPFIASSGIKPTITKGYLNPMLNLSMRGLVTTPASELGYAVNVSYSDSIDINTMKDELISFLTGNNIKWDVIRVEDNTLLISVRSVGGMQSCTVE